MRTRTGFLLTGLLSATLLLIITTGSNAAFGIAIEHFSVKEYNDFHDVLHPLQHEALPNRDFKTIRARAGELTTLGEAIVKLGTPAGVKEAAEFQNELKVFAAAIAKFKTDALNANDTQLEESYLAVHDSFEMLAGRLPRK